jgi:hypothetical protein
VTDNLKTAVEALERIKVAGWKYNDWAKDDATNFYHDAMVALAALRQLEAPQPAHRWIPVSERLPVIPEGNSFVMTLMWSPDVAVLDGAFSHGVGAFSYGTVVSGNDEGNRLGDWFFNGKIVAVTHWMYLPEEPQ